MKRKLSQVEKVDQYLSKGRTLTQLQATKKFKIMRLGAVIYTLKKQGMSITTDFVMGENGKQIAKYSY